MHTGGHAADDDDGVADGNRHHAEDDIHLVRLQHACAGFTPTGAIGPRRSSRPSLGYSIGKWEDNDRRRPLRRARNRNARHRRDRARTKRAAYRCTRTTRRSSRSASSSIAPSRDILQNEITTIDNALTRPWTVTKNYRRDQQSDLASKTTAPRTTVTSQIGDENYVISGDGQLMPAKKDQPPPDLKYFKQPRK